MLLESLELGTRERWGEIESTKMKENKCKLLTLPHTPAVLVGCPGEQTLDKGTKGLVSSTCQVRKEAGAHADLT
jgi:hypothetical protein